MSTENGIVAEQRRSASGGARCGEAATTARRLGAVPQPTAPFERPQIVRKVGYGIQPGNAAACFTQVVICASSSYSPSWMSLQRASLLVGVPPGATRRSDVPPKKVTLACFVKQWMPKNRPGPRRRKNVNVHLTAVRTLGTVRTMGASRSTR